MSYPQGVEWHQALVFAISSTMNDLMGLKLRCEVSGDVAEFHFSQGDKNTSVVMCKRDLTESGNVPAMLDKLNRIIRTRLNA